MKTKWKENEYATVASIALNILKAGLSFIRLELVKAFKQLKVKVKFSNMLPKKTHEIVRTISEANAGKVLISQAEAVHKNPLVKDPSKTLKELDKEAE
ncbi:MAG: hypothetical protein ABI045_06130 [Flavobacteriales bacterium]